MKFITIRNTSLRADQIVAVSVYRNELTIHMENGKPFGFVFCNEKEAEEERKIFVTRLDKILS